MPLLLRKDGTWYYNDAIREHLRARWEASVAEDPDAARARAKASVKADVARTAKHHAGRRKDEAKAAEDRLLSQAIRVAEAERSALEAQRMAKRNAIEAAIAQRRTEKATLRHLEDATLNIRARDPLPSEEEIRRARLARVFGIILAEQAGNSPEEELEFLGALHTYLQDGEQAQQLVGSLR